MSTQSAVTQKEINLLLTRRWLTHLKDPKAFVRLCTRLEEYGQQSVHNAHYLLHSHALLHKFLSWHRSPSVLHPECSLAAYGVLHAVVRVVCEVPQSLPAQSLGELVHYVVYVLSEYIPELQQLYKSARIAYRLYADMAYVLVQLLYTVVRLHGVFITVAQRQLLLQFLTPLLSSHLLMRYHSILPIAATICLQECIARWITRTNQPIDSLTCDVRTELQLLQHIETALHFYYQRRADRGEHDEYAQRLLLHLLIQSMEGEETRRILLHQDSDMQRDVRSLLDTLMLCGQRAIADQHRDGAHLYLYAWCILVCYVEPLDPDVYAHFTRWMHVCMMHRVHSFHSAPWLLFWLIQCVDRDHWDEQQLEEFENVLWASPHRGALHALLKVLQHVLAAEHTNGHYAMEPDLVEAIITRVLIPGGVAYAATADHAHRLIAWHHLLLDCLDDDTELAERVQWESSMQWCVHLMLAHESNPEWQPTLRCVRHWLFRCASTILGELSLNLAHLLQKYSSPTLDGSAATRWAALIIAESAVNNNENEYTNYMTTLLQPVAALEPLM